MQEISVHAAVSQHPYIATLYDAVETVDTFTLVEEYMPNGDLFDVIKPDLGMPEEQAMRYSREIISAIEYIHLCGTAHRDIKPENVCLSAEDSCRIIDFGHAAFLQDCKQDDYIGTVPYMAFELLAEERGIVDFRQTDMWAFGATVFVMCTGKFPWREATYNDKEFLHFAAGGAGPCHRQRWAAFSPALNTLLRNTMCIDTRARWTASEARVFIEQHWGSPLRPHLSLSSLNLNIPSQNSNNMNSNNNLLPPSCQGYITSPGVSPRSMSPEPEPSGSQQPSNSNNASNAPRPLSWAFNLWRHHGNSQSNSQSRQQNSNRRS